MTVCRHIVVHADDSPGCEARLRLARRLADRLGATVGVVHLEAMPVPRAEAPVDATVAAAAFAASAAEGAAPSTSTPDEPRAPRSARASYDRVFDDRPDIGWIDAPPDDAAAELRAFAHAADLLVIGQPPTDAAVAGGAAARRFTDEVLVSVEHPVLVVPREGEARWPWTRALLAWDASPGCERVLRHALPLLQLVDEVDVVTWGDPVAPADGGSGPVAFLVANGVRVSERHEAARPASIGDALLHACALSQADLLVAGCYGHSPRHERWFGGVTRTLLARARVPVLTMH